MSLARPTQTVARSTSARAPRPANAWNPVTSGSGPTRWRAAAAMAWPIGCSLSASTAPARRSSSASSSPATGSASVSAISPRVRVPVLSKTTLVMRRVCSSTSTPLMSTPSSAPRPVPTMIAMGVASPSAHGQEMISTATAATSPACGSPASRAQPAKVARATAITAGTNTPATRSASRWMCPLDAWASSTSRTIWARAVSDPTLVARTVSTPAGVHRGPGHRVTHRLLDRHRLAGEHGLVDRAGPGDHLAVGRDLLARADLEQVPGHDLLDRDHYLPAVADDPRLLGPELQQGPDRLAGPTLGSGLEEAAQDHEGDDHRGRLEVQLHPAAEQLGHREPVGGQGPHRDERGHAGRSAPGPAGGLA